MQGIELTYKELVEQKVLIIILGPTASGKTGLSIKLAEWLDIEVISADSRQVFKFLDIGTAKPNYEELSKVKHHFINIINPDEYYSAGIFAKQASDTALDIFSRGKIPVVVGGSGLYIKAVCDGFFNEDKEESFSVIRTTLENRLLSEGKDALYCELEKIDPAMALLYNDKNPRRIIRALEFFYSNGITLSEAHNQQQDNIPFKPIYFGINHNREHLYDLINHRTEIMWKNGIVEETQKVLNMGYPPDLNSLNTVGYKECIDYLNGNKNEADTISLIKQNTRHYAKRQMTWFRKNEKINWLDLDTGEPCLNLINHLNKLTSF